MKDNSDYNCCLEELLNGSMSAFLLITIKVYNNQMGCAVVRRLNELNNNDDDYQTKMQGIGYFVERSSVKKFNG